MSCRLHGAFDVTSLQLARSVHDKYTNKYELLQYNYLEIIYAQ